MASLKPDNHPLNAALLAVVGIFAAVVITAAGQDVDPTTRTAHRKVAVTFDDLPGAVPGTDSAMGNLSDLRRQNHQICQVLRRHHAPAIGFVIERKLQVSAERDARAGILEEWIESGFELGNHTYSHTHFNCWQHVGSPRSISATPL
jgi:peptidoglycan/xylan/chitin deacetylase (PgdA/CDA1 family)